MSNEIQDKINALPLKSFKVLAAVIPAMFDDESSCYLEDITIEGMSVHAVTGTLPRLMDFVTSEDLAASGSGRGYLINLNPNYDVYSLYAAIKTRAEATAEEARCYHVTRCKFDERGNPSSWSTDSSWSTLDEARARAAELVAELGGEVDPSSLSAHSCEVVGDAGVQLVYDTLPARDNTKTYVGKHNGAYLYETTAEEEGLEPLVKALPSPPSQVEEEARVLRVTPPQVDALRALGYEARSCKLRLLPSQEEALLASLYAEREKHTRGARRVYTSLIARVSKPASKIKAAKSAPRARFSPGDLRIQYADDSAHIQLMQLVDAAEDKGLISKASAEALRYSARATPPSPPEGREG